MRVMTPGGQFPSLVAAARAFGISRQTAWARASRQQMGWRFLGAPKLVKRKRGRPRKAG